MPKTKLTSATAALLQCEPGKRKTDFWDDGTTCAGLVLEVRESGGRTWQLRYRTPQGEQKVMKLARFGDASFEDIRREARRFKSQITLGGNPAAEKANTKAIPTYAELAAQHLAYVKPTQRSYDTTELYIRVHIKPRWGKMRLTDIRTQDIATWLGEKAATGLAPATVEKIRVIMSRSFSIGAKLGTAGCDRNPVRDVPKKAFDNRRTRFLNADEVKRLLLAADGSRNKDLRAILTLLLTTGARVSEILGAQWRHVDLARRTLFVPMTKNGKGRHLPLATQAVDTIERLKEKRKDGAVYLFPSRFDPAKPLGSIKHAWQAACTDAMLFDTRIHDLRHTAASAFIAAGVGVPQVAAILGHRVLASTARYVHATPKDLLAAVEAGAAGLQIA